MSRWIAPFVLLCLFSPAAASSQGTITGVVVHDDGTPVKEFEVFAFTNRGKVSIGQTVDRGVLRPPTNALLEQENVSIHKVTCGEGTEVVIVPQRLRDEFDEDCERRRQIDPDCECKQLGGLFVWRGSNPFVIVDIGVDGILLTDAPLSDRVPSPPNPPVPAVARTEGANAATGGVKGPAVQAPATPPAPGIASVIRVVRGDRPAEPIDVYYFVDVGGRGSPVYGPTDAKGESRIPEGLRLEGVRPGEPLDVYFFPGEPDKSGRRIFVVAQGTDPGDGERAVKVGQVRYGGGDEIVVDLAEESDGTEVPRNKLVFEGHLGDIAEMDPTGTGAENPTEGPSNEWPDTDAVMVQMERGDDPTNPRVGVPSTTDPADAFVAAPIRIEARYRPGEGDGLEETAETSRTGILVTDEGKTRRDQKVLVRAPDGSYTEFTTDENGVVRIPSVLAGRGEKLDIFHDPAESVIYLVPQGIALEDEPSLLLPADSRPIGRVAAGEVSLVELEDARRQDGTVEVGPPDLADAGVPEPPLGYSLDAYMNEANLEQLRQHNDRLNTGILVTEGGKPRANQTVVVDAYDLPRTLRTDENGVVRIPPEWAERGQELHIFLEEGTVYVLPGRLEDFTWTPVGRVRHGPGEVTLVDLEDAKGPLPSEEKSDPPADETPPVDLTTENVALNPSDLAGADADSGTQVFGAGFGATPSVALTPDPDWLVPGGGISDPPDGTVVYLTSRGVSTGEAFDAWVIQRDGTPAPVRIEDGVLEPVRLSEDQRRALDAEIERLRSKGVRPVTAEGYCFDFEKAVPAAGAVYRFTDPATHARYAPHRGVMAAGRRVRDAGGLNPDSDPEAYYHAAVQWAIWTRAEGFDRAGYEEAFVEHTRKNVEAVGQAWTAEVERQVRDLVPDRWEDIQTVLRAAAAFGTAVTGPMTGR